MHILIKNMVQKSGIRNTLNYLWTENFSDSQLEDLESHHILNHGIPSMSVLCFFEK